MVKSAGKIHVIFRESRISKNRIRHKLESIGRKLCNQPWHRDCQYTSHGRGDAQECPAVSAAPFAAGVAVSCCMDNSLYPYGDRGVSGMGIGQRRPKAVTVFVCRVAFSEWKLVDFFLFHARLFSGAGGSARALAGHLSDDKAIPGKQSDGGAAFVSLSRMGELCGIFKPRDRSPWDVGCAPAFGHPAK